MREKIKRKLRSRRGMSLLLSLLLFLVCAAVGSVALTAGTASSGTISERAKLDQRYFSVTSAAELLRKKFDGQSVNVTIRRNGDEWTIDAIEQRPTPTGSAEAEFVKAQSLCRLNDVISQYNETQPDDKQILWANDAKAIIDDAVERAGKKLGQYALTAYTDSGAAYDNLKVNVTIEAEGAGLALKLENADGNEKFRLKMKYAASVKEEILTDVIIYEANWKISEVSLDN